MPNNSSHIEIRIVPNRLFYFMNIVLICLNLTLIFFEVPFIRRFFLIQGLFLTSLICLLSMSTHAMEFTIYALFYFVLCNVFQIKN